MRVHRDTIELTCRRYANWSPIQEVPFIKQLKYIAQWCSRGRKLVNGSEIPQVGAVHLVSGNQAERLPSELQCPELSGLKRFIEW